MITAIVQARTNSTRLPKKVLLKLGSMTVLEQVVRRIKKSKLIKEVIIATTTDKSDDIIANLCHRKKIKFFRGDMNNVLDRYYQAAKHFNLKHICRITSDCPLIDPDIIDLVANRYLQTGVDYISNSRPESTYPDGLDLEIFETIEKFLPDIVCIEGGQTLHPSADLISTDVAQNNIHQSLQTYVDVFSRKGYTLVAAHQDNIFVKNKFASLFNVSGKSILDFYLDGILAYPRIPWIYVQMLRYGISNSIIEKIVAGMNIEKLVDVAINGDITAKASWVDTQNQKISSVCNDLRNKDL